MLYVPVPYTLYGLPLTALKYFNLYLHHLYGWNIVGPFLLQLIPRLVMLALSLTVDFTVYQVGVYFTPGVANNSLCLGVSAVQAQLQPVPDHPGQQLGDADLLHQDILQLRGAGPGLPPPLPGRLRSSEL